MHCPRLRELPDPPKGKTGWPWTEETTERLEAMSDGHRWPKVSIVTPSYNQAEFLEETIRSVLLQGYPALEYMIIDGGSSDGSSAIIKKYSPWLSYWISEPDRGQSHAINKGFKRASGTLIAWLNSDDTYLPRALFSAARAFAEHPNAGLVHGICEVVDRNGRPIGIRSKPWNFEELISRSWSYLGQPAVFMRASVLAEIGYLDETLHNALDWELWIRFGLVTNGVFIPEHWATARLYADAKSIKYADNSLREHRLILRKYTALNSVPNEVRQIMKQSLAKLEWREGERSLGESNLQAAGGHFIAAFRTMPYAIPSLLYGAMVRALPLPVRRTGSSMKHTLFGQG